MHVEKGAQPSDEQRHLYNNQREYLIPVFNRGQSVRISYLNAADTEAVPSIWLSAAMKGVKVKFQVPQQQIFGVSRPRAATLGAVLGIVGFIPLAYFVQNTWIVGAVSLAFGYFVVVPGAYIIKGYRKLREIIGG